MADPSASSWGTRRCPRAQAAPAPPPPPRAARPADTHTRATRDASTSPVRSQLPSTSAAGSTSGRGSDVVSRPSGWRGSGRGARVERRRRPLGVADAIQAEVAHVAAVGVKAGDVPALAAVDERVRLDDPRRELVLVGLVVVQAQQPALHDRLPGDARPPRAVAR